MSPLPAPVGRAKNLDGVILRGVRPYGGPRRHVTVRDRRIRGAAPEVTRHLAATLTEALRPARPSERDRLLETVWAHLTGDGSPTTTARLLYRHRNTVLNHLRRFSELTGLDLAKPSDVATAVLSLRALRRLSPR